MNYIIQFFYGDCQYIKGKKLIILLSGLSFCFVVEYNYQMCELFQRLRDQYEAILILCLILLASPWVYFIITCIGYGTSYINYHDSYNMTTGKCMIDDCDKEGERQINCYGTKPWNHITCFGWGFSAILMSFCSMFVICVVFYFVISTYKQCKNGTFPDIRIPNHPVFIQ